MAPDIEMLPVGAALPDATGWRRARTGECTPPTEEYSCAAKSERWRGAKKINDISPPERREQRRFRRSDAGGERKRRQVGLSACGSGERRGRGTLKVVEQNWQRTNWPRHDSGTRSTLRHFRFGHISITMLPLLVVSTNGAPCQLGRGRAQRPLYTSGRRPRAIKIELRGRD